MTYSELMIKILTKVDNLNHEVVFIDNTGKKMRTYKMENDNSFSIENDIYGFQYILLPEPIKS